MANTLRGNTAQDYLNSLMNAPRRNQDLQPVAKAIGDQFLRDSEELDLNPGEFELVDAYGATKVHEVTEQNTQVVFEVNFYFYGGIISGWSVQPKEGSFDS